MGSTIAEGTVIKGRISGDGDLEVHGHVEGSIELAGELTVGATGLVKSDLRARRLTVSGAVRGDLHATEAVVLEPGARVVGDLVAPSVGVREGALVRGRITTGTPAEAGEAKAAAREPARAEAPKAIARPAARPEPVRAARPVA
ncbi:MAG: polymer-forming cytoskeletal protein, partial [Myxococcales bacterium]|nr:polymer-forming cytoskeletal protein [Myxococcales bacterium]